LLALLNIGLPAPAIAQPGKDQSAETAPSAWETLDVAYQEFADQFFRVYIKKYPAQAFSSIDALAQRVATAPNGVEAVALIRANLDLVSQNASKSEFGVLLDYLYRQNDTATVQRLADLLKKQGNPTAVSRNYFLLAKYYESRSNWRGVQAALKNVDTQQLSVGDRHYYHLLMGFALQNQKRHREALKFYQEIPDDSPYSRHARLNEGTAFLRQGWWTEAHMKFENAIQFNDKTARDAEFRNRTLVVLGYSQLNYEFYRDARNTFRKIAVDSTSSNKALMGIGLAAAYQKDFAGAANAFAILIEKPVSDLNVDEAFLLLPVARAEVSDAPAAVTAYQNAIRHYENKIQTLRDLQAKITAGEFGDTLTTLKQMDLRSAEIYGLSNRTPDFLRDNYQNLLAMRERAGALGLSARFTTINVEYNNQLRELIRQNIESRIEILNSYLSQAKFGVAQLYDKP